MRRWLICFSLGIQVLLGDDASTVSGAVQVSSATHASREQAHHAGDIVVWLESTDTTPVTESQPRRVQMLQKDKMFHPHILPILVGTTVEFPNADPFFHNAFSNYDGQLFDVALYPPGTSRTVVFRRAGVARVFCNIHPSMSAIILVLKTPLFAKVNADGRYRIPNVPAGHYELHFYDEWATTEKPAVPIVTVDSTAGEVIAPELRISETGYAAVPPHRNKYGQNYPAAAGGYGGEMGPPK